MAEGGFARIKENYDRVTADIAQAAHEAGRNPGDIRLVTVTKRQPSEVIHQAFAAGARIFGENYAEEALPKIEALPPVTGCEWHMIGHVQGRKARLVVSHFALVHSLDSLKLAQRYEALLAADGGALAVLLEFNLGGETSKTGWPGWDEARWESLLPEIGQALALPHLQVKGLMTMPPLCDDPELARPYFQQLRKLRDYLAKRFPAFGWQELSMGTSADYRVAIQEGATLVRIGQAILGPRPED